MSHSLRLNVVASHLLLLPPLCIVLHSHNTHLSSMVLCRPTCLTSLFFLADLPQYPSPETYIQFGVIPALSLSDLSNYV